MHDDQYSKLWLKKFQNQGSQQKNPDVTINCFPYGLTSTSDNSIDLIEESKPAYYRLLFKISLWLLLSLIGAIIAFLMAPLFKGSTPPAIYLLMTVCFPWSLFKVAGDKPFKPLENYISTKLFKLVAITAQPQGLKLIVKKQEPMNIPWTALESIKLNNGTNKHFSKPIVVLDGARLKEPVEIALSTLHTRENWMVLSHAISNFAPHIEIDEEIGKALTLPSVETSFTELWLNSLASAPEQASLELLPEGEKLNNERYVVISKLASGGQGHAYRGLDTSTNQEVVIKTYLLPIYQGKRVKAQAIEQLESESLVLQRINHPHIVLFIDWFCQFHRAFLVLNRVDGISLRQWVKTNGIPTAEIASALAEQMCDILEYLHSFKPPIIHRDFTPDNLIIDENAKLTLIDFTIAEPTGAVSGLPPAGQPAYMPPEQFRGETCVQSDIYAFGGTLQFLLTGSDPEALEQTNLRQSNLSIPDKLAEIVFNCRSQEVTERFQSIKDVQSLLTH